MCFFEKTLVKEKEKGKGKHWRCQAFGAGGMSTWHLGGGVGDFGIAQHRMAFGGGGGGGAWHGIVYCLHTAAPAPH
jgi:hypothetical protein